LFFFCKILKFKGFMPVAETGMKRAFPSGQNQMNNAAPRARKCKEFRQ
jgi:hypothetical protein